jgi:hypothetical protein
MAVFLGLCAEIFMEEKIKIISTNKDVFFIEKIVKKSNSNVKINLK